MPSQQGGGLKNFGNTCFMNAGLQCLLRSPSSRRQLETLYNGERPDEREMQLLQQLDVNQAQDQLTEPLAHKEQLRTFRWYTEGEQQDAVEYLQEKLSDFALPNVPGQQSRNLFEGTWRNQTQCLMCTNGSVYTELFKIISLPICKEVTTEGTVKFKTVEMVSLQECFETLSVSHVEWGGCPEHSIKDKPTANHSYCITEAPQILWVQLKRWNNDGSKQEHQVAFATVLDLSRFAWQDKVAVYRLHGVVLHEGTCITGKGNSHYLVFVKEAKDQWWKYDDATRTAVSEAFVLSLPAYMLMYEKVQSDAEQQAMTHQQPGAARDFTPGAYTALPTAHAQDLRPAAAAAAAANIKQQYNTQPAALTPLEERNALMGGPGKRSRNRSSTRRARKHTRQQAALRPQLDVSSAAHPAAAPLETASAGSAASLSGSSSPARSDRSSQSCQTPSGTQRVHDPHARARLLNPKPQPRSWFAPLPASEGSEVNSDRSKTNLPQPHLEDDTDSLSSVKDAQSSLGGEADTSTAGTQASVKSWLDAQAAALPPGNVDLPGVMPGANPSVAGLPAATPQVPAAMLPSVTRSQEASQTGPEGPWKQYFQDQLAAGAPQAPPIPNPPASASLLPPPAAPHAPGLPHPTSPAPSAPAQVQMVSQLTAQLARKSRALAGAAAATADHRRLAARLQQAAEEGACNLAAAEGHAAELRQQQQAWDRLQAQEAQARKAQEEQAQKAQEAKRQAAYAQKLREVTATVAKALAERAQEEAAQQAAQQAIQQSGQLSQPGSGQAVDPASTGTASGGLPEAASRAPTALPHPPATIPAAAAHNKPAGLPPPATNSTGPNAAPVPKVMHSTQAGEGATGTSALSQPLQQQPTAAAAHNAAQTFPGQADASGLHQMSTQGQNQPAAVQLQAAAADAALPAAVQPQAAAADAALPAAVQPQAAAADAALPAAVPDILPSSDVGDVGWMYGMLQGAPATPGGGLLAAWRVWSLYRNGYRQRRGSAPPSRK